MSTICVLQAAHHVYQTHDSLHTVLHTAPNSAIPNCEQVSIWAYYNQEQVDLLHVIIERYQSSRRIGRPPTVHASIQLSPLPALTTTTSRGAITALLVDHTGIVCMDLVDHRSLHIIGMMCFQQKAHHVNSNLIFVARLDCSCYHK